MLSARCLSDPVNISTMQNIQPIIMQPPFEGGNTEILRDVKTTGGHRLTGLLAPRLRSTIDDDPGERGTLIIMLNALKGELSCFPPPCTM